MKCNAHRAGRGGLSLSHICTCLAGAGLSSSSAFVCVAALALLAVFDPAHLTKTVRALGTLLFVFSLFAPMLFPFSSRRMLIIHEANDS